MGLLQRSSTIVSPARARASSGDPFSTMYAGYYPPEWGLSLSSAGMRVSPDLALTLTAIYSGVTRIGGDWMRMPAHLMKVRDDGDKERVRGGPTSGSLGSLAYKLRWKPNIVQTAAAFYACLAAQYTMRSKAYAEILRDAMTGDAIGQLVPRHPDRVREARLANGKLQFKIIEPTGPDRTVTQEEMLYIHDTTGGGFGQLSRMQYGTQAIGTALGAEHAAGRFFKSGMTAALLATHPEALEDTEKASLHGDITRFAAGAEHNFGLMLVEQDIKISALGIDPQKAQMMEARNFGVREVARLLKMPPELLFADNSGTVTGRSWEEINSVYITGCLGPMVAAFEQAMQDALILAKDTYVIEILMDGLFRGNLQARAEYYQAALEGPWMWPSEIRQKEGLNKDEELDRIAEKRYRPGDPKGTAPAPGRDRTGRDARADHRFHLLLHDNALRVLRRERIGVEKIAKRHATDVDAWHAGLREFYGDHARFVAETMRLDIATARDYCAQHGTALQAKGVPLMDEHWERREAEELAALALEPAAIAA